MIHIVSTFKDIEKSNAVFLFDKKADMEKLDFLKLDEKIIKKIQSVFKEKKDVLLSFFVGHSKFETLYLFLSFSGDIQKTIDFIGKHTKNLPENYTLFLDNTGDIDTIFDTCLLSRYSFTQLKKEKKQDKVFILCHKEHKQTIEQRYITLNNIFLARDLGELPSNILTPEEFVKRVKSVKWKKTKVKILDYKEIQKKKLGLIEAVGKGSDNKPYMLILERIVDKKKPIHALIGKGITFDTGGNQIKPGDFMYEMKGDMGGAAVAFSLMKELDESKVDTNLVVCLCLAENTVSGNAYKPSDIITGYTGKTVEIIHTDAEGRLVLADGISYISKNYKTETITTIATLTGACMVALGFRYAGIMGNNQELKKKLLDYSQTHTEKYIELPFDEYLISKTKSEIADFKNLDRSVHAGASMGATFLYNFLENNEKFLHIDIAGAYINAAEPYGKMPKGMTGFGVESLSDIFKHM